MLDQDFQEFRKAETRKWVGDLPDGWRLVRNQGLFDETKTIGFADEELLSVTIDRGIIPQTEIKTKKDSSNEDKSKYKLLEPGDLAYNKMRMWQGAIGRSDHRGIVSPAYVVIRPRDPDYSRYFHFLYRTHRFITEANRNSYGLCDDMNSLRYEDFKTIHTPVPPKDTMYRIVSFLDEKTAEIDAAIAKKRRLIDLLNEQKAILINRAVTKGLNPDAPMKDSGVDWIGEIPAHWEIKQLRYVSSKVGSGVTPTGGSAVYPDEGIYFLRSQNVHFDGLRLKDVKFISEKTNREMSNSQVCKDDVLLNITGASIGRSCVYNLNDAANVNQHVCIIRPKKGISSQFLSSLFEARVGSEQVWLAQNGASREGLNFADLRGFVLPIPPAEEQLRVQGFLSDTQAEFRAALNAVEAEISTLNEFKQTLIANAVTGKIKI